MGKGESEVQHIERLNTPIAVVIVLVLFLVVDGLLFYGYPQSRLDTAEAAIAYPDEEQAVTNTPLQAVVRVVGSPAQLSIQKDGRTVLEQVGEPGSSWRVEADRELVVRTGNGGAVRVEANGRDFGPLGASGESVAARFFSGAAS
jgi:hypothetical protein